MIKSWKEILMAVAAIIVLVIIARDKKWRILREPLLVVIYSYAVLHVVLIFFFQQTFLQIISGLLIDLRYILLFVLIYIAVQLYPLIRRQFIFIGVIGALIVTLFAVLQVTILPNDVLKYIGYGQSTIAPYLTVDQNQTFVRINSTLRGPNPLGAYGLIVLTIALSWMFMQKGVRTTRQKVIAYTLTVASMVAIWWSYSRSALVATIIAAVSLLLIMPRTSKKVRLGIIGCTAALIIAGAIGVSVGVQNNFVSNIILHENPSEGNNTNSNDGHVESLADGFSRLLVQPFGGGIGSTGSASLYGDSPLIIENQYLFVAHEVGWLGLVLFMAIFLMVLFSLWRNKTDWLSLGVLSSGIGLAVIGILLPVWVDDTVSIIWWGLAALAIGSNKLKGEYYDK